MININVETIVTSFSTLLNLATSLVFFQMYRKFKDRAIMYFMTAWIMYFLYWFFVSISYLFLIPILLRVNVVFLIASGHLLLLGIRELTDISIFEFRFFVFTFFSGIAVLTSLSGDVVSDFYWSNGDRSYILQGDYRVLISILAFMISLFYLEYTIRVVIAVPNQLRFYARLNFAGAMIFGPGSLIVFIFEISTVVPGLVPVVSAFGVWVSAIAITRSPQLIYTLPFTVYHLSVVNSEKGYPVYTHSWVREDKESTLSLFSSALTGLSIFASEAVGKGDIREISFSDGKIIITHDISHDLQFVILTTGKVPPVVREGLEQFKTQFIDKYRNQLIEIKDSPTIQISIFSESDDLIHSSFPFLPHYG